MPNVQTLKQMTAKGGTLPYVGIPGLHTKDFTYRPDINYGKDFGYSFDVFTHKRHLDNYIKSPIWRTLRNIHYLTDITFRTVEILQGSEMTV
jgi:hypothetical protein